MKRLAWSLWAHRSRPHMRRYARALQDPESAQRDVFTRCMHHLTGTAFAREHGLEPGIRPEEFRARVPVIDPAEWESWTRRILRGEPRVLTRDPVERLVPTSGSTGPAKLIPMTAASRREYALAVNLWIGDCLRQFPEIRGGRAYIATSPAQSISIPNAAVPVGYAEDGAYVGPLERRLLNHLLAVPTGVAALRGEAWRQRVRRLLLRARDLRFLSLWHPSYLDALFDKQEMTELPGRWPNLKLISCWADGACAAPAARLLQAFPGAVPQRKGLWLTEGVISLPWCGDTPLALLNGYMEFEEDSGKIHPAHELEAGRVYRPVLTNRAGLVRVRLGDKIHVSGFSRRTPCVRWVGRADAVSDLCGEKLTEAQVEAALARAGISGNVVLRADAARHPPGYVLHSDNESDDPEQLDRALRRNPHYDWARALGQLAPPVRAAAYELPTTPGRHLKSKRLLGPEDG